MGWWSTKVVNHNSTFDPSHFNVNNKTLITKHFQLFWWQNRWSILSLTMMFSYP